MKPPENINNATWSEVFIFLIALRRALFFEIFKKAFLISACCIIIFSFFGILLNPVFIACCTALFYIIMIDWTKELLQDDSLELLAVLYSISFLGAAALFIITHMVLFLIL